MNKQSATINQTTTRMDDDDLGCGTCMVYLPSTALQCPYCGSSSLETAAEIDGDNQPASVTKLTHEEAYELGHRVGMGMEAPADLTELLDQYTVNSYAHGEAAGSIERRGDTTVRHGEDTTALM